MHNEIVYKLGFIDIDTVSLLLLTSCLPAVVVEWPLALYGCDAHQVAE